MKEVNRLKARAAEATAIRIWYSNAPYSMCGFYQVCTMLVDYDCPVSAVKLPEYKVVDEANMIIHAGMVSCCGVNCKACEYFGQSCEGCDVIKGKPFWIEYTGDKVCDIYHSCIEEKRCRHCGICPKLLCVFYNLEDPTKSHEENEADLENQLKQLEKK